jgi:hypothetical protein
VAEVRAAAQGLGAVMDRLDPAVVTVDDAMAMVEVFCRIERMAGTAKTLMAKRATDFGALVAPQRVPRRGRLPGAHPRRRRR